jgi:hypothetical protein
MAFNTSETKETFETTEPGLSGLLEDIHRGKIQLPDFQRGWVWDDDHIRDLIASVSRSFPIGAVMTMESGGAGAKFKPRPVQGVTLIHAQDAEQLILDGQQRLTSLYLALGGSEAVKTRTAKGEDIERVYYLDMAKCLDPEEDRFDAVVSVPADRMRRTDFNRRIELDISTSEKEFEANYFPLTLVYDNSGCASWRQCYIQHFHYGEAKIKLYNSFEGEVLKAFWNYRVPVIKLLRETPKEAVCLVFEKVNTGGVALTVFELVTATFAADNYQLRQDWEARQKRLSERKQLRDLQASDYLTAITLLASYQRSMAGQGAVSCKRKDILRLQLDEYRALADRIEKGFAQATKLLTREMVFDAISLPYQTQLIPLAAICAVLDTHFESDQVKQMLSRWYWCGVFGELYGGANEARFANDIQDVINWINGGTEPRTVRDSNFAPIRLLTLQSRLSAAYKGVAAQLMKDKSKDFISGDDIALNTYFETNVDIHHIFPRSYCEKQGLPRLKWNSVVNKAPLSARTNRIIGGNPPSVYLSSIERNHKLTSQRLDTILRTHQIDPTLLRADDFDGFIRDRAWRLLDLIESATGKTIAGRDSDEAMRAFGGALVAA